MSKIKVNEIVNRNGSSITIGDANTSTVAINSGTTLTGFSSTGIDDNATSTAITIDSSQRVGITEQINKTVNDSQLIIAGGNDSNQGGNILLYGPSASPANTIIYRQGTSEILRMDSAGLKIGGTGSANALNDYEEGDWTPVFQYTTTTPSFSYVNRYGRYTKIGRMVMINFSMNITSIDTGSANGDIQISGLPFTSKNPAASGGGVMVYGADVYANTYDVSVNINDNATLFTFIQSRDNEGWINLSSANDAGQLLFQGSIVYDTDS